MKAFKLGSFYIAAIAAFLCLASVSEACIFSRGVHRRQDRRAARHEGNAAASAACACGPSCACAMPANPTPAAQPAAAAASGCANGNCSTRGGGRRGWFFNN